MDNNPLIKTVLVIALCSTLGVSFASSLPQVNVPATKQQQQVKPNSNEISYQYDATNPLQLVSYHNSVDAYNEGVQTLQYNAQNEIVVDDHGNKLSYDALGEMVSFDNSQTHQEVNYTYDVESHQMSESVIDARGKTIASQAFYYSTGDKAQMIAESDSDGNQLSYLFAEEKIGSLDNNNEANLYITDQAGSVVALVSNSQLSHEYVYSPYGIDTDLDTSTPKAKNAQGFDGQRTDHATGYQFLGNGYRAYNPILHRFMQMDDIRYSPFGKGGINGYVFGNNNPIMNFDPSGHSSLFANIVLMIASFGLMAATDGLFAAGFEAITANLMADESTLAITKLGVTVARAGVNYLKNEAISFGIGTASTGSVQGGMQWAGFDNNGQVAVANLAGIFTWGSINLSKGLELGISVDEGATPLTNKFQFLQRAPNYVLESTASFGAMTLVNKAYSGDWHWSQADTINGIFSIFSGALWDGVTESMPGKGYHNVNNVTFSGHFSQAFGHMFWGAAVNMVPAMIASPNTFGANLLGSFQNAMTFSALFSNVPHQYGESGGAWNSFAFGAV